MAFTAISAFLKPRGFLPTQPVCTFVLAGGCNLSCSFCAIKLRNEREEVARFKPQQYREFILNSKNQISGVAIVGDEPLLPQAWESTQNILEAAKEAGLSSAIVTNGTYLAERCERLSQLDVSTILVSVDGDEKLHDHVRGKAGTFKKIVAGLKASKLYPSMHGSIVVASVMLPNKIGDLSELIGSLLLPTGIKKWALSPLLTFDEQSGVSDIHSKLLNQLPTELPDLIQQAVKYEIDLSLDDSFNLLPKYSNFIDDFRIAPKSTSSETSQVIRISPDGTVSLHGQRFQMSSISSVKWDGKGDVNNLLNSFADSNRCWCTEAA